MSYWLDKPDEKAPAVPGKCALPIATLVECFSRLKPSAALTVTLSADPVPFLRVAEQLSLAQCIWPLPKTSGKGPKRSSKRLRLAGQGQRTPRLRLRSALLPEQETSPHGKAGEQNRFISPPIPGRPTRGPITKGTR